MSNRNGIFRVPLGYAYSANLFLVSDCRKFKNSKLSRLFYLLRLQVPSLGGTAPHSVVSILCSMLILKGVSKLMKEKIVDGLLHLLTLADEVVADPVADINLTELSKIPGKYFNTISQLVSNF